MHSKSAPENKKRRVYPIKATPPKVCYLQEYETLSYDLVHRFISTIINYEAYIVEKRIFMFILKV